MALRKACYKTKGIVFPRQSVVTRNVLDFLRKLKAVARLHVGTDNTDLEACHERDIKVIHANSANVRSNAEYLLATLLLHRGLVPQFMNPVCSQRGSGFRVKAGMTIHCTGCHMRSVGNVAPHFQSRISGMS